MRNGLIQHVTMVDSTSIQWVTVPEMKLIDFTNSADPDEAHHLDLCFLPFMWSLNSPNVTGWRKHYLDTQGLKVTVASGKVDT